MDKRFEAIQKQMDNRFDSVDNRFDIQDKKFDQINGESDNLLLT